MKKYIWLAALNLIALNNLIASDLKENTQLRIHCYNNDIGPLKDGYFLDDQKHLASTSTVQGKTISNVYGKNPGTGLFNIPMGISIWGPKDNPQIRSATSEDCLPLFALFPQIRIIKKNGENILNRDYTKSHMTDLEVSAYQDNTLKLPGQTTSFTFDVNPQDVQLIILQLFTARYGYTTGGGNLWSMNPTPVALSEPVVYMPQSEFPQEIYTSFSWPTYRPETTIRQHERVLGVEFANRYQASLWPSFNPDLLDPNWKITCGLHTNSQEAFNKKPFCFSTLGFNRSRDTLNIDCLNFQDAYPFYAGHPLTTNVYRR